MSTEPAPPPPPRSAAASAAVRDWTGYFEAVGDAGPRETLVEALDRFGSSATGAEPPLAIDLGCGTGRDTLELLRRGWRVLAVDGEREGIERLLSRPEFAGYRGGPQLAVEVASFARFDPPRCRLVNASFALPFCPPEQFAALWSRLADALEPGGRFAGQLFGEQDAWALLPDRTHHTAEQAEALLAPHFETETFRTELYGPDPSAAFPKRWHIFHIVARRLEDR